MKILIMGLPGSGKTTLAQQLTWTIRRYGKSVTWYNADEIRRIYNDWDFTRTGRLRQAERMRDLASTQTADFVICDFVAPLEEMRNIFSADLLVWVDTIDASEYADTNRLFEKPAAPYIHVTEQDAVAWSLTIFDYLK